MLKRFAVLAAVVSLSLAGTPAGFRPVSNVSLTVSFNGVDATDDPVIPQAACVQAPQLGTSKKLPGSLFAILMVDLDIPTDSPPATSTLLHWLQLGLTQSSRASHFNSTSGPLHVYAFEIPQVAAAASYIGPSPPARIPLSHRYTQLLVDISSATQASLSALTTAAQTRQPFDAYAVLKDVGLDKKVVAGNFFNVTNPGAVPRALL